MTFATFSMTATSSKSISWSAKFFSLLNLIQQSFFPSQILLSLLDPSDFVLFVLQLSLLLFASQSSHIIFRTSLFGGSSTSPYIWAVLFDSIPIIAAKLLSTRSKRVLNL